MSRAVCIAPCFHCGAEVRMCVGHFNRQRKRAKDGNACFFCSKVCFGLSRRLYKSEALKVAEKKAYDAQRRVDLREELKAAKHAYYKRTYDPVKARERRAEKRDWHRQYAAEYRKNPEWIAHKQQYDKEFRSMEYGEFAECHMLLVELEKAIRVTPWYDRAKARGYYDNFKTTRERKVS